MNYIDWIIIGIVIGFPVLFAIVKTGKRFFLGTLSLALAVGGITAVASLKAIVNSDFWNWLNSFAGNLGSTNIVFWVILISVSIVAYGLISLVRRLLTVGFTSRSHLLGLIDGLVFGVGLVFVALTTFVLIVDMGQFNVDPQAIATLEKFKTPLNESVIIGKMMSTLNFKI